MVVVEVRLTCVINVVANLFEKPDRFRNAPPPRIKVLDIEHSGKICRRVRSTTDTADSEMGVFPTWRSAKAQFVCGMATVGLEADGGSVLLVASADPFA